MTASFSILTLTNLPLALVSFLSVLDVIVKGLSAVCTSVCCGYLFTFKLTLALPSNVLKSGTNLLTAKNNSPANVFPTACPDAFFLLCSKTISKDYIKEETIVVDPSSFT